MRHSPLRTAGRRYSGPRHTGCGSRAAPPGEPRADSIRMRLVPARHRQPRRAAVDGRGVGREHWMRGLVEVVRLPVLPRTPRRSGRQPASCARSAPRPVQGAAGGAGQFTAPVHSWRSPRRPRARSEAFPVPTLDAEAWAGSETGESVDIRTCRGPTRAAVGHGARITAVARNQGRTTGRRKAPMQAT
jgi:hypothetical protein